MILSGKTISLLVAYTKDQRTIGAQGKIPWNLSSERNRFKEICKNKPVIMGRKSFEEIGKPLSYCTLVVVSKSLKSVPEGCILADSLEKAIEICQNNSNSEEILVAGGEDIYRQTIPYASKIYATEIYADFEGNSHFPEIGNEWQKISEDSDNSKKTVFQEENITYEYVTFVKH